jgi:PadR family transcriptional regulator, regulatory protein PadR
MADPGARHWGTDLRRRSGVRSGTMYPILWRMLGCGWLTDGWEDPEYARAQKRPPRRYYELTDAGNAELAALLESARTEARFRALFAQ